MSAESKSPVRFLESFEAVKDADEEVFILYTEKQSVKSADSDTFRGLGFVDSHKDVIQVQFELKGNSTMSEVGDIKKHGKRRGRVVKAKGTEVDSKIEIELHQDKTALRSRKGDTGSVLWKASIDFAQMILQQCYTKLPQGLIDPKVLRNSHVLELGAGTGLLSIALSPLVEQYTVTDIAALTPLIRKNVNHNGAPSNVSVAELDWVELQSTSATNRPKIFNTTQHPIDLLLAVDCLYHPSLIPPFVETIDYLSTPARTTVIIVSELRQEDVMREFLEAWLSTPDWQILRAPNDELGKHYVIWIGWKA